MTRDEVLEAGQLAKAHDTLVAHLTDLRQASVDTNIQLGSALVVRDIGIAALEAAIKAINSRLTDLGIDPVPADAAIPAGV